MRLEVTTEGALAARQPFSEEVVAARRARASVDSFATPEHLLRRAQRSDRDATSALFQRYCGMLCSFLLSRGARDNADDAVQDALLSLLENDGLAQFRPERPGSFRAWLRSVVMNHWSKQRRKEARHARLQAPSAQYELERQQSARHAQCTEQEVRRGRSLAIIDQVWERVAEQYREAGEQALFEYLYESLYTGIVDGDVALSRELDQGDNYVTTRRNRLQYQDYAKALLAEYRQLCLSRSRQGLPPLPLFRVWRRELLDDLG